MRLVFAGTPEPAVPSLRLLAAGPTRLEAPRSASAMHGEGVGTDHDVVAVITRRDAPFGRKRVLTPSPVAAAAEELGLDVLRADRLDADVTEHIAALAPDLGVIVAYGGLVREPLLSTPAHGWINLHFSLLPRWRGAAPVQHALIAGDTTVGASVFQLVPALDAGDVFAERAMTVPADATAGTLLGLLAEDGASLVASVVDDIAAGSAVAVPQSGEVTLAPKLADDDGRVRWKEPRAAVLGRIRGVTPEPGAHTTIDGARLKIHAARAAAEDAAPLAPGEVSAAGREVLVGTGDLPIVLDTVQPAGRGAMSAGDWFRGLRTPHPVVGT